MRTSSEAKKTEKPDAQLQVGDAKDVDFGRVWHLPPCVCVDFLWISEVETRLGGQVSKLLPDSHYLFRFRG